MIRFTILCLFLTILFFESCSQGYIVNMDLGTHYPNGRDLYISKCNACHQLYNPDNYTETAWDSILVPMQKKAKLDDEQRNAVFHWIIEIKKNSDNNVRSD